MRIIVITFFVLLLAGCKKEPDPTPKPPQRYHAQTQRALPYVVTIWSTSPNVLIGSNEFKLHFQTEDKEAIDPGNVSVAPILVEAGKTPIPSGQTNVQPAGELGVYRIVTDLPAQGRWRFNVSFGSHSIGFYYNARLEPRNPEGAGKDETGSSR
jgi:hypothetical protein